MIKPKDYDQVQKYEGGQSLPAGGYICRIVNVLEGQSKAGNEMLTVSLDIAEGEYTNFYQKQFSPGQKWKCNAYILCYGPKGETNRQFKTFVEEVRESNTGWEPQWNDNFSSHFKNTLVGALFGREQFEGSDGRLYWHVKPRFFKSVKDIRDENFTVPEDKPLKGSAQSKSSNPINNNSQYNDVDVFTGYAEVSDDDIPFL